MKRNFSVLCFVMFAVFAVNAQQGGFTGPAQTDFSARQMPHGAQGFTGPAAVSNVSQVQTFWDRTPAVLRGNIVSHLGGDRYLFRDSSGEIMVKIGHNRWWGLSVGVDDTIEIGGELKRDKRTGWIRYFDVKNIRMAS